MFDIPNKNFKSESCEKLKLESIKLNFKWDRSSIFLVTQGREEEKFCSKKDYKYIIFVDENGEVYLTRNIETIRNTLISLGYTYAPNEELLHYNINETSFEVKNYINGACKNIDDEVLEKNYESYKDLVGEESLELISLYGIDYDMLPIERGSKGYASIINTTESKIYLNVSYHPIVGEYAKYEIIFEENVIVCLDEYGRLFALQFENTLKLEKVVEILKNAKFKKGLPCYLRELIPYRIEKQNDAFKVLLKRIEKINKKNS